MAEDPGESQSAGVEAALISGSPQGADRLEGPFGHQMAVGLRAQVDARPRWWSLSESVLSRQQASRRRTEGCYGHPLPRRERQDVALDPAFQQAVAVLH